MLTNELINLSFIETDSEVNSWGRDVGKRWPRGVSTPVLQRAYDWFLVYFGNTSLYCGACVVQIIRLLVKVSGIFLYCFRLRVRG